MPITLEEGYWISWRGKSLRGPARWSVRHFTRDGRRTICSVSIPTVRAVTALTREPVEQMCSTCRAKLEGRM